MRKFLLPIVNGSQTLHHASVRGSLTGQSRGTSQPLRGARPKVASHLCRICNPWEDVPVDLGTASSWLGLVTGLFGGALGGMLIAGPVARAGEAGRDRYRAEAEIRGVLATYRDMLRYDRDHSFSQSSFPNSYTSPKGRERMASDVLRPVAALARWQREDVCAGLDLLIGTASFNRIQAYGNAPDSMKDEAHSKAFDAIRSILAGQTQGLIQAMVTAPGEHLRASLCETVITRLGEMISTVTPPDKNIVVRLRRSLKTK